MDDLEASSLADELRDHLCRLDQALALGDLEAARTARRSIRMTLERLIPRDVSCRAVVQLTGPDGPVGGAETFTADDWPKLVGKVNYWLRIDVAPYWPPDTLRMTTEEHAERADVRGALRAALFGLAVAWGMHPRLDPERAEEPLLTDPEHSNEKGPA